MPERESHADLEFWSGTARGGSVGQDPDPTPPRKPYRSSFVTRLAARLPSLRLPERPRRSNDPAAPRGKVRPVAAAALLAGLAGAWLFVGHQSHDSTALVAAAPATPAPTTTAPTTARAPAAGERLVGAIARAALRTDRCAGLSTAHPHLLCVVDGAIMDVALYTPGTVGAAFRRIAGAPVPPRSGPAACAADRPDERAWSVASAPLQAVGRYVCRLEGARATIWWTHGDRLLHAEAGDPHDGDLAKLFSWWRAHPSA
jgi:hypothetical protein